MLFKSFKCKLFDFETAISAFYYKEIEKKNRESDFLLQLIDYRNGKLED